MGFRRFRKKLFRSEPTRLELYLRLARGLNIQSDYQTWIETWENDGPSQAVSGPLLPLSVLIMGEMSDSDGVFWNGLAEARRDEVRVIYTPGPGPRWQLKDALRSAVQIATDYLLIL